MGSSSLLAQMLVGAALCMALACGGGGAGANPSGGPPSASLAPVLAVSRTTGVAPLSVFFDATATLAQATSRPFHELEYRWDFGDTTAGTWSRGSNPGVNSKNRATGANTAHVFETPGTYTVTLTVTDGTHSDTKTATITVTDPGAVFASTTTCISTGSDFTGAPTGSTHVTASDFPTALKNALAAGARRILFRRGDTFTASTRIQQAATGPLLVGAFGSGSRPILKMTSSDQFAFESWTASDWRFMDFEIDGSFTTARAVSVNGTDFTALRISAHDVGIGFALGGTRLAVVDSDAQRIPVGSGIMSLYAQDVFGFFVAGSLFDNNGGGEYDLRYQGGTYGVISNNTFLRCGDGKATFTLRGDQSQTTYIAQYHQISDNLFDASTSVNVNFIVTVNPQNSGRNERIKDVVIERNKVIGCPGGMYMISLTASDVTIRNNLLDGSNVGTGPMISASYSNNTAGLPAVSNVHIYHNTLFSSASNGISGVILYNQGMSILDSVVKNNFLYAPNCLHDGANNGHAANFMYDWGTSTLASNNPTDTQVRSASPNLIAFPPVLLPDWGLADGCYGRGSGAPVPVWSDFFQNPRTATTARDLGAIQR